MMAQMNPQRFIPTRVGNTFYGGGMSADVVVHPHASGEHFPSPGDSMPKVGSSPREWGTQYYSFILDVYKRFIPTRVGNTVTVTCTAPFVAVHPHASGEHWVLLAHSLKKLGSSPREWGTLSRVRRLTLMMRFIPTRVGNT